MKATTASTTRRLVSFNTILLLLVLAVGVAHAQTANLFWNITSGVWDIGVTANWTGDATLFTNGDAVTFANMAGGTVTVTSGGVSPGSTTVSAASGTYTLTGGPIGGSGTLTKSGSGTLTLSGMNTYSGQTIVAAGALTYNSIRTVGGGASALGASTTVANGTITLAGTMTYTGGTASSDRVINLRGTGTFYNSGTGPLTLSGGITGNGFTFTARGTTTISETGVIATGSGIVQRTDLGTFYLSNPSNSFSGILGCLAGTISVSSVADGGRASAIGAGTAISMGQANFAGQGALQFTGAGGGSCDRAITINYHGNTDGGIIENTVAGQTLILSGPVNTAKATASSGNPLLQLIGAGNGVMSGVITNAVGALAITKSGAGTWTLSNVNPYSGPTTVSGGTLVGVTGGSCSNSAVTIANTAGCTLGVQITDNTRQWSCSALTFGGTSAALQFDFGFTSPSTSLAPLQVNGNVIFSGTPTVTVKAAAIPAGVGTYPLMTWTGTASGTAPTTVTLPPNLAGNLGVSGKTLYLNITQNNQGGPLTWQPGTGAWDINTTANWKNALGATVTYKETTLPGDSVLFDDTPNGIGPFTVILTTTVTPGSVTFNNTRNYTISGSGGVITGSTAFIKTNTGTLTLSQANTFTGGTIIKAGTVNFSALNNLGNGGITFGGGTLQWNSGNPVDLSTRTVTLGAGGGTLDLQANNVTLSGSIGNQGTGGLTKTGSGRLTLSAANTYSGGTALNAGQLNINHAAALGTGAFTISGGTIDNTSGGAVTLTPNNAQNWNGDFTFTGTANLNLGAGVVTPSANRQVTVSANTLTVGGAIGGGAISLTKAGAGALALSGANTYSGGTTLSAGQLNINNAQALGAAAGVFTISGGTIDNTSGADITTVNYPMAWNGDFTYAGSARSLNLGAGAVTPSANRTVTVAKNTLTVGGAIGGAFNITKAGGGTLTLNGSSTYTGQTTVSAGTLSFNSIAPVGGGSSALGAPTSTVNGTINLGATMTYTGGAASSDRVIHLTGNSVFYNSGSGLLTLGGGITGGNLNIVFRGSTNITEAGIIATGSGAVTRTDSGTLSLSNPNNSFSGALGCLAGTISVSSVSNGGVPSAIGQGTSITFGQSGFNGFGTLQFTGANGGACNRAITISSHSGTADGGIIENTMAGQTLTLSGKVGVAGVGPTPQLQLIGAGNGVMSGVISDAPGTSSLALTKAGAGAWTLSGANTYTGPTTVSAGTLVLRGVGSIASSSYLNVAAGALLDVSAAPFTVGAAQTLAGAGTVAGAVTVNGVLIPGTGAGADGTLTFNNPLTLGSASTTYMRIARAGEALTSTGVQVSGAVTYGGTLVIANVGDTVLRAGDNFQLFGASGRGGAFASISYPPGYTFAESLAVDGRIVVVTAPPTPDFQSVSVSSGRFSLTWLNNYLGWMVQSNSVNLANSNYWFDVPGSDGVTNISYTINPALTNVFYRMRGQSSADFAGDPLAPGAGLNIDSVWSGDVVGFALLTLQNVQVAGYYNSNRYMTVAARNLDSTQWYYLITGNQWTGWDVHNYITLGVDPAGHLHLTGDYHNQRMVYFRSTQPLTNAAQLQIPGFMPQVSPLWNSTYEPYSTYPTFLTGPNQEFIFSYRSHDNSASSSGSWFFLKYDTATRTYSNPAGANPPFAWTNIYSVYPSFTVNGGYLHCLYVWRASDGVDNFRLSYARTADLTNWTDAFGRALALPLTQYSTLPIVDDVPQNAGLLNGQPQLSFDRDGVPLVAYSRFDANSHSQVYVARPVPGSLSWSIVQLTTNNYWGVQLNNIATTNSSGSVANGFVADDPVDGLATVSVSMTDTSGARDPNSGNYTLDETTLTNAVGAGPDTGTFASASTPIAVSSYVDSGAVQDPYVDPLTGDTMAVERVRSGGVGFANLHYYLRYEGLPSDRSYGPKYDPSGQLIAPTPAALQLYRTAADFDASVYGVMFKPANGAVFGAMTRTNDSARVFGWYLSSPVTGMANYAQWTFNISTPGEYALGGSAFAPLGTNGSFWVQIDDGPLIDWRVSGYWTYQPVTSGATKGMVRFNLAWGSHLLRLYAKQVGTAIEYLWLNQPSAAKTPSLAPVTYTNFIFAADAKAVVGASLSSTAGSNPTNCTAHFEIPVFQAGNHLLLGRTQAQDGNSDSFYLSVNGGARQLWTLPISGTNWTWRAFGTKLNLSLGTLDLDVSGSQGGAGLDSFMLLKVP